MGDAQATGTAQKCPVCGGCGTVPPNFYSQMPSATSTARERCRSCDGSGLIWLFVGPVSEGEKDG